VVELSGILTGIAHKDGRNLMEIEVAPYDGSAVRRFALHRSRCVVTPDTEWVGQPVFVRALDTIVLEMVVQVV
jgi:hypothetical protein